MWQYNYTLYPDELCHYGVKGMKWRKHVARAKKATAEYRNTRKNIESTRKAAAKKVHQEQQRALERYGMSSDSFKRTAHKTTSQLAKLNRAAKAAQKKNTKKYVSTTKQIIKDSFNDAKATAYARSKEWQKKRKSKRKKK